MSLKMNEKHANNRVTEVSLSSRDTTASIEHGISHPVTSKDEKKLVRKIDRRYVAILQDRPDADILQPHATFDCQLRSTVS